MMIWVLQGNHPVKDFFFSFVDNYKMLQNFVLYISDHFSYEVPSYHADFQIRDK